MTTSNSNLTLNGNSGSNTLTGGAGNDQINGRGGDDVLSGGAGNDEINGGAGNDILDGGSGSDELEGGSGNDTLIYKLAENNVKGTHDEYDGGSGTDTLELQFTRAEWMNATNQTVLQSYLNWASKTGSNCHWDDEFTFKFGNAKLEIENIEKLVVKVDGVEIKNAGHNTVDAVDDNPKSITEDEAGVQNIDVLCNDSVDDLVKELKLDTDPAHGTVALIKPTLPNGSVDENANNWYFNYTPDTNYYQKLNVGDTATESFTYTVTDANGDHDTATVYITITGLNDKAIIGGVTTGEVTESGSSNHGGTPTATGQLTAADVDNTPNTFIAVENQTSTYGKFSITSGGLWTYTLDNNNRTVDTLNVASNPLTDRFTIKSIDGTEQTISVDIKGAYDLVNSKPVVDEIVHGQISYAGSANVTELINLDHFTSNPAVNTDLKYKAKYDFDHVRTGQFTFSDSDLTDTFTITSKATGTEENLGTLTFDSYTNAKDSNGNIIDGEYIVKWIYTVKDSDLDSLNTPVTGTNSKDDDFIVTIDDGTTTVDTKIMLNLFGRDQIKFSDVGAENNILVGLSGEDYLTSNPGHDVLYMAFGYNYVILEDGSDVAYSSGQDALSTFTLANGSPVVFAVSLYDKIDIAPDIENGLAFGGDETQFFNLLGDASNSSSNKDRVIHMGWWRLRFF